MPDDLETTTRGWSDDDYGRLATVAADLSDLGEHTEWMFWPYGSETALVRRLDADRYVAVVPLIFTWAIIVGPIVDALSGHQDRWCYRDLAGAVVAATAWDGTGEPDGWHRHPGTDRRR